MYESEIHLLDVGRSQYGDCVLCRINDKWILVDGGHRSDLRGSVCHKGIPDQICELMGLEPVGPIEIDLLVISHTHADHIGCLPEMILNGMLKTKWAFLTAPDLAWPASQQVDSYVKTDTLRLYAILREEHYAFADRDSFEVAAEDAASLQHRYRSMIAALKEGGTNVVLHGQDDLRRLESAFSHIGMRVIGPKKKAIVECARLLEAFGRDFLDEAEDIMADGVDQFWFYERMMNSWRDNLHIDGAFGPSVNMQSSIIVFDDGQHQFLFTGDSQLEKPDVPGNIIKAEAKRIRNEIARLSQKKPFHFVKVGHHGSHNSIGTNVLKDLGTDTLYFGLCTGSESRHHPSATFLEALTQHSANVKLGRTDTNGRISFHYKDGQITVDPQRGELNDGSVSGTSEEAAELAPVAGPADLRSSSPQTPNPVLLPVPARDPGPIEIKIPYNPTLGLNVSIQIKIEPSPSAPVRPRSTTGFTLAGGRRLPKLLFLTCSDALRSNVGEGGANEVLAEISAKGHTIVDLSLEEASEADKSIKLVQDALNADAALQGVVLIGGYDVVPALNIDTYPEGASEDERSNDPDDYYVWTDNLYGDADDDGLPELPVSRVPDGKSADLLRAALSAPATGGRLRHGVHNVERPFALEIFKLVPGEGQTNPSFPYSVTDRKPSSGDYLYFMLHGEHADATRFWGETEDGELLEALQLGDLQIQPGAVVFTGCCWGALPVMETAKHHTGGLPTPRTANNSIALACLNQGALAYVGCTGVHYSPRHPPYDVAGAGIHKVFWRSVASGSPPSRALLEAKQAMASQLKTHDKPSYLQAMDVKHVHQFCLLGLGW
ncbi:MBL fold metallo-hydrolase [Xanthomonas campestris pv. campestris]|uniref:MBL fold metallo-hydrolase n=1 Tax=Xanthomonas campestris TaxID=339 RepID=UPI001C86237E|nr:MBL fold metallo-hydrolase [Xanthomonas campestris]MDM7693306.1 MBL fold metallo-hydrolase [Xanthomonas campestris pv. campestris]MDM7840528.1 MBL fold metallo-hydrolase [Xanthomonas campestris pv. campestris]MDM7876576.1 MBL fold metallo-hydrolase [Xanthomonas campestris pv. campestris]